MWILESIAERIAAPWLLSGPQRRRPDRVESLKRAACCSPGSRRARVLPQGAGRSAGAVSDLSDLQEVRECWGPEGGCVTATPVTGQSVGMKHYPHPFDPSLLIVSRSLGGVKRARTRPARPTDHRLPGRGVTVLTVPPPWGSYHITKPRAVFTSWPVKLPASSEAMNTAMAAASSGSPASCR